MGQATRTTKLSLNLGKREEGGANSGKRAYLDATAAALNQARAFYLDFFLAHTAKLEESISYYSEKHQEQRERRMSPNELLTWAEFFTVATKEHPFPWKGWNFSERFPHMPFVYRRSFVPVPSLQLGKERQNKRKTGIAWGCQSPHAVCRNCRAGSEQKRKGPCAFCAAQSVRRRHLAMV